MVDSVQQTPEVKLTLEQIRPFHVFPSVFLKNVLFWRDFQVTSVFY